MSQLRNFCRNCGANQTKDETLMRGGFVIPPSGPISYAGREILGLSITQRMMMHTIAAAAPEPVPIEMLIVRAIGDEGNRRSVIAAMSSMRRSLREQGIPQPFMYTNPNAASEGGYFWNLRRKNLFRSAVAYPDLVTEERLRAIMASVMSKAVNASSMARAFGVSQSEVFRMVNGPAPIPKKVTDSIGYEKVILYRKKSGMMAGKATGRANELYELSRRVMTYKDNNGLTWKDLSERMGVGMRPVINVGHAISGTDEVRAKMSEFLQKEGY